MTKSPPSEFFAVDGTPPEPISVGPAPDTVAGAPPPSASAAAPGNEPIRVEGEERPAEAESEGERSKDPDATWRGPDDGVVNNTDATWDPQREESGVSNEGAGGDTVPGAATAVHQHTHEKEDPGKTFLPSDTHSVVEVWGSSCDDATPGQTLKAPGEIRPPYPTKPPDTQTAAESLRGRGYELAAVLGEGGVGVVYQAVQKSVNREIAVKMIKPGVGQNIKERQKFVSEALVTGRLDHPNIVPIHDLDSTDDGQPFYTMKMVRGTPWSKVLRENSLEENLNILLDVCDAVSFAHSRSVIHRDLKPDNVMLGEFGEVQVMDWGLGAMVSDLSERVDLSRSQAAGGTPSYMAPEMVTGEDGPVGTHSDIYLLGAILFEIVTGKPPHAGKRVLDTLVNARDNVIQPTECGGVLLDTALRAMQTAPADRYHSVTEFKDALLDYRAHAESINLCDRAAADLSLACENQDYERFAKALFGFREALTLWEGNEAAQAGVIQAQLEYARSAFSKGDLDLAGSTLDQECPAHQSLTGEITQALERREGARRRLKLFRVAALTLTAAVIVILTVASVWIYSAKRQATVARDEAVAAKERAMAAHDSEVEHRKLAEVAKAKAQQEEARAVQALSDLEKAYADLVEAQEQEKRAWAQAAASDLVATETRDELAKTGMLLDNSWWAFDEETARQRQQSAAQAIGLPVELEIALAQNVSLTLVLIPPGEFVMGSPPEEEARAADEHLHRVRHGRAFYLGKFEVTEVQWQAVLQEAPPSSAERAADATLPVSGASHERITQELLPALNRHAPEGYLFRLPTEAEWEYACRAGTATAFNAGDDEQALASVGWFLANSEHNVQPVGGKQSNAFGLYDMHGNVSEICADRYTPGFYLESAVESPVCVAETETLVVRGGSVLNLAEHCRAAYRSYVYEKNQYPFLGIRLALVPLPDEPSAVPVDPGLEVVPQP